MKCFLLWHFQKRKYIKFIDMKTVRKKREIIYLFEFLSCSPGQQLSTFLI